MSCRKIALITLTMSALVCFFMGCENYILSPPALNLPEVSFDPKLAMISLDGFRIQMSARMTKQVAEERGYRIDSMSDITFDDVINGESREDSFNPDIFLERNSEAIVLSFDYGKVKSVKHEHLFHLRQEAEKLLESYLKRYPELTHSNETENFKAYMYKSNELAYIVVSIHELSENAHRVSITVCDNNYSQRKRNQEYRQEYSDKLRQIEYGR